MFGVVDTLALPPAHRFDWWCETVSRGAAPTRISSDHAADFVGRVEMLSAGPLEATRMSFPALRSERTPALIKQSDPETYELTLVAGGAMSVAQSRREAVLSAGDFVMWSSSQPYTGRGTSSADSGPSQGIVLHLPRKLLPFPEGGIAQLLATPISASAGIGAILAQHLRVLFQEASRLEAPESARLGTATMHLAHALLAQQLDAHASLEPEARGAALLARIEAFIEENLANPQLSPHTVAAGHHVSVRMVHQLFRQREETVSAMIRRRRLERCRHDLADPRLDHLPVHAVASRNGLEDPAGFSRSFRHAYGLPPSEYRRTVRAGRGRSDLACALTHRR
ncbi:helix-turn-helix domain-containing protein [Streptomyces sp. H39-S7]|uniref:AraC-like ligand-binding domain-containing protein n=1 Tax=Streptomyces sp. H39-S7 TaxID=3004357 RepID=UPI0022AECEA4|nr:helix-turn-helix domain-containing protein [Streptomyces sp. H39-S7]MCZ4124622.1 helix-turn-helix domain-containing protein [Streptomyces sp. H39-S7]